MGKALPLVLCAVAACYGPHPVGGTCSTSAECPPSLMCIDGTCGGVSSDATTDTAIFDADLTCSCSASTLHCASDDTACPLGCVAGSAGSVGRCARIVPSNSIPADLVGNVSTPITISGAVAIDTDTGAITGALIRAAGTGLNANIYYDQKPGIGIFVFDSLTITNAGMVKLSGTRAVAFLVGHDATLGGVIDGTGGGAARSTPGPGGGLGAPYGATATGCGPGAAGQTETASSSDGGGGGGGGGAVGGAGGAAGMSVLGGAGGIACIAADLQPLVGGSGGAGGGPGILMVLPTGGGGGGALQVTALGSLTVNASINIGGAGGDGGFGSMMGNAPGGCGGGAGGGVLLEAITINAGASALIAANGGGGGGGGNASLAGQPGQKGQPSMTPALGGAPAMAPATAGGDGGAGAIAAESALDSGVTSNGGGGGGAVGRIFFRTQVGTVAGSFASPAAGNGKIVVQ